MHGQKTKPPMSLQQAKRFCVAHHVKAQTELQDSTTAHQFALPASNLPKDALEFQYQVFGTLDQGFNTIYNHLEAANTFYQTNIDIAPILCGIREKIAFACDCFFQQWQTPEQIRIARHCGRQRKCGVHTADRPAGGDVPAQRPVADSQRAYPAGSAELADIKQSQSALVIQDLTNQVNTQKQQNALAALQNQVLAERIKLLEQENANYRARFSDISSSNKQKAYLESETLSMQKSQISELLKSQSTVQQENAVLRSRVEEVSKMKQAAEKCADELKAQLQSKRDELALCQAEVEDLISEIKHLE